MAHFGVFLNYNYCYNLNRTRTNSAFPEASRKRCWRRKLRGSGLTSEKHGLALLPSRGELVNPR